MKLLLCAIFLLFLEGVLSTPPCNPYHESWQLCSVTPICRERMFIDVNGYDLVTYQELIQRHPANEQAMMQHWFCNETSSQDAKELWILLMAHTDYCPDKNEFYVSGIGCVCRDNKICEYKAAHKIFFPIENTWAIGLMCLATLGLGGYAIFVLRRMMSLFFNKKRQRRSSFASSDAPFSHSNIDESHR